MRLRSSRCLLLCLMIFPLIFSGAAAAQSGSEMATPAEGGDFSLTDHNDKPFRLSDQRGKVVLLFFGYTSCTEACPIILGRINSVFKQLGADRDKALAVFISVDPQRDSPQVLREYVHYFSAHTIALTGKKEEIDGVVKQYGARYEIERSSSALGYHVNHTTDIYLIDPHGRLQSRFKHTEQASIIAECVRKLLLNAPVR
jgi:cytochrome oxidase Cu insertion factor (SCO1/SenC/PrrC family)